MSAEASAGIQRMNFRRGLAAKVLLTPKAGRSGHVEPSDISEVAPTAGLQQTSTVNAGKDWSAARLVLPRAARSKK